MRLLLNFLVTKLNRMPSEVFLVPYDKNTLKKLLFISTYYELSEDEVVKDIIDSYSEHEQYSFYRRVVFGEQKKTII